MQFFFLCFFVIAVICVILGFRKSSFGVGGPKQYCTICGWTKEKVQLCVLEQHHRTTVTPLCFDCSLEYDAVPLRDAADDTSYTAWA